MFDVKIQFCKSLEDVIRGDRNHSGIDGGRRKESEKYRSEEIRKSIAKDGQNQIGQQAMQWRRISGLIERKQ
jgi:hypothetical protein